jgi:hypothetical protein
LTDPVEKENCFLEVRESLEQALEDCQPEPPTPTCAETAKAAFKQAKEECQTTFADPTDCINEA